MAYLVEAYGWEQFNAFYRDIHPAPMAGNPPRWIPRCGKHFNRTLNALEADFLAFLRAQTVEEQHRADLRLTVAFYDTLRHYQRRCVALRPLPTAWLPDIPEMRRAASWPTCCAVRSRSTGASSLLVAADQSLRAGDYTRHRNLLREAMELAAAHRFSPTLLYNSNSAPWSGAGYDSSSAVEQVFR